MGKYERERGARYDMNEEWRPVVGYEGRYEVSNMGRVKSLPNCRRNTPMIMALDVSASHGYVQIHLSKNGKARCHRVHKLVMEAFTDYRSKGYVLYQEIDHIDGDKTNNALSNLRVVTHLENMRKAHYETGINYHGRKCIDLDTGIVYENCTEAAKAIGGNRGESVRRVCTGERKAYKGHHFADYREER